MIRGKIKRSGQMGCLIIYVQVAFIEILSSTTKLIIKVD